MSVPPGQPPPPGWQMPPATSSGLPADPPPPYSYVAPPPYTPGPGGAAYMPVPGGNMPPMTKSGHPPMMQPPSGMQYAYVQPMHPGTQQPVTSQPVMMAVLVPEQPAGHQRSPYTSTTTGGDPRSKVFNCKKCRESVTSKVSSRPTLLAWACGIFICLIGCDLGCCLIPCCIDDCMDTRHACPSCGLDLNSSE